MIADPKFGDLNWQFLIPAAQSSYFVFDNETSNLSSISLPLINGQVSSVLSIFVTFLIINFAKG